jgi:hypothetical protein
MRKAPILNPKVEEFFKKKLQQNLISKIKNMKPLVKSDCPESFIFYKTKFQIKTLPNLSN